MNNEIKTERLSLKKPNLGDAKALCFELDN